MTRISPVLVLLLAAGCAQAGITDWLNPFRMFGGKSQPAAGSASGIQQSPKGAGHRGPRQLYPASAPSHGQLGSPAGHLDDGFKPSFPPGFANPPSHSPNLNPFATAGGHGPSATAAKGPLLPHQLTVQHSPNPGASPLRPRGRFGFRSRAPPPQHALASATIGGPTAESPVHDGAPVDYSDYSRLAEGLGGGPSEYDEGHQSGPPGPQIGGAPIRGPPGPPPGYHHRGRPQHRPQGPPPSFAAQGGRPGPHFGRPLHHGAGGPQGGPGGPSYIDGGNEQQGPFSGRPLGPAGPGGPPGGRPGSDSPFFASSPGGFNSIRPGGGQDSQSPFAGAPQSGGLFGQDGPSENPFGSQSDSGPQGPPQGGPNGLNGPQAFFNPDGNDYPEQFQGGSRETRQPQSPLNLAPEDFQPQPNGPPEGAVGNPEEQNAGFYGAIHNDNGGSPSQGFFGGGPGGQGQEAPSLEQSGGASPFLNPNSQNIFGNQQPQQGYAPQQQGGPAYAPQQRPRKPPLRLGLRNPLASAFQTSSSNVPSYGAPLMMSASGGKAISLPVPKSRVLRPFARPKAGVILPLSSPRDPNYRPMLMSPSALSPVTASFEPDTAASGHHGGYGDVGLTHNGDRILYHVAGHQGPYSYRFGFDTGKGYNRIFRFEEKDGKGHVKGKYGFYDKSGKLNIINYQAHPKHGYHAERGHSHGLY